MKIIDGKKIQEEMILELKDEVKQLKKVQVKE